MRTIITYGTFDVLHAGHINIFKRAKSLGPKLIVGLSTDEFNGLKHKSALLSYENRRCVVEAIRYVDLVIPETNWEQKVYDVEKYEVDVFFMGDDWDGHFDFSKEQCEVVYLSRTDGISSTLIREEVKENNTGQPQ
jgi:glycerol-3-phosphate cytidylyltransferase